LVFAGTGAERAGATAALRELAERLGCPVIPSMAGRGAFPREHPLYFHSQSPAADALRRDADVILVVGSRVGNLDTPYDKYWGDPAACRMIQVDIDPRHIGVSRPVALGIVADARATLEGLLERLGRRTIASRGRTDVAARRAEFEAWSGETASAIAAWRGPGIHPAHAMAMVGEIFGRDAVYCTDGGMTSLWAALTLPATRANSYHSILEFGMLGTGIPSAIGARLGAPDRTVVCVSGDGAAGFNAMELQTAAREGLDITVVVMAEGEWTMEIPNEVARYGKTFGTGMGEVQWHRVAEGLGCHGECVDRIEALPAALARAKAHPGPALVCVRTSKEANLAVPESAIARFFEVYFGPSA
jgi:acetolactate synthase-1/2/3 large subunit